MHTRISLAVFLLFGSQLLIGCSSQPRPSTVGLHEAALTGNLEAIATHIDAGSDLDARDEFGSTPLIVAATFGKAEVANALVEGGADLQVGNNDGSSPLHIASFLCYPDVVEILLENGADPNARNGSGSTPLQGVEGPFEDVKGIYDAIGGALGPLGLTLDYDQIKATRPRIAEMLRSAMQNTYVPAGASEEADTAAG